MTTPENYFHRPGLWLVKKADNGSISAELLEGIEEPIKMFPFINVEKYRNEIESAIIKCLADDKHQLTIKELSTKIIYEITQKIIFEKENQTINLEDLYE